ncbi:MAG: Clp protease ClpP [Oscillospiraceae bacterium]|jgi:ATP-dependent Clp protease protease subunit|nr:Clp protease ClpP [Oscillospiraceae bacterium]
MNKKINKFWCFQSEESEKILRIDGIIAKDSWYEDDVTPKQFKAELDAQNGDITVLINSVGGDAFASSQIYNMLRDYGGKVTVKIDSIAASAASVIAMAGDEVLMSPLSLIVIHDPCTVAIGNTFEMQKAIEVLSEIKEAIINAYQAKSGLSRRKIADMMSAETWLNAKKAVELGFADGIMFGNEKEDTPESLIFSRMSVTNEILNKLKVKSQTKLADSGPN